MGIFTTILIGAILFYILGKNESPQKSITVKEKVSIPKPTKHPFTIIDQASGLHINKNDNFNFKASGSNYIAPISKKLNDALSQLKTFLLKNSEKQITITGLYTASENNTTSFKNLGLARANAIINYLVTQGFSKSQLKASSQLNNSPIADQNHIFYGPVTFNLSKIMNNKDKDNAELLNYKKIAKTELTLNFEHKSATTKLTAAQKQQINTYYNAAKALNYKINIIGHTDNVGQHKDNIALGQHRADFVKQYILSLGKLSANQINATSKGERQPIADNATESGRFKNRRTTITINNN